jgi:hypothetical protein
MRVGSHPSFCGEGHCVRGEKRVTALQPQVPPSQSQLTRLRLNFEMSACLMRMVHMLTSWHVLLSSLHLASRPANISTLTV